VAGKADRTAAATDSVVVGNRPSVATELRVNGSRLNLSCILIAAACPCNITDSNIQICDLKIQLWSKLICKYNYYSRRPIFVVF